MSLESLRQGLKLTIESWMWHVVLGVVGPLSTKWERVDLDWLFYYPWKLKVDSGKKKRKKTKKKRGKTPTGEPVRPQRNPSTEPSVHWVDGWEPWEASSGGGSWSHQHQMAGKECVACQGGKTIGPTKTGERGSEGDNTHPQIFEYLKKETGKLILLYQKVWG